MSIRKQILAIFLSIIVITLLVVSYHYYRSSRNARLEMVYNHMESISQSKVNRMIGIIQKRREQVVMLQLREGLLVDFNEYLKTRDKQTYVRLLRSLEVVRDRVPSFREIHLLSLDGVVQVSSSPRFRGQNFAHRESFRHAMKGEICMHEFYLDQINRLNISLTGLLTYGSEDIGVLAIITSADDVLSIISDYTGLGSTGETTLARRLSPDKIYYLTPTRFHPVVTDSLIVKSSENKAMDLALRGVEGILTDQKDYRDQDVIASPRYIALTGWGMTTKIDKEEAMAPINKLLWDTIFLSLILITGVAVAGYFFARKIVKPIKQLQSATHEIAAGNIAKRINYSSKNELGELASTFNLMADKLAASNTSLKEKLDELDKQNDELYRFAYIVSHDLKSPLFAISSLMDAISESLGNCDEPDVQQMLRMAESKTKHMLDLINGILHYSVAGVTAEEPEPVNLQKLVVSVIDNLEVPAHITVTIEELPVIQIERVLVIQIYQNLISNAVKYMDKPLGKIIIGYKQQESEYVYFVSDNGRGIEKRNFTKIFEVFNLANRVPGVESTGIGLSIVKKIVESKGGSVWLESEAGRGSTFFFTLPQDRKQ